MSPSPGPEYNKSYNFTFLIEYVHGSVEGIFIDP
jgi:hypothetical protein